MCPGNDALTWSAAGFGCCADCLKAGIRQKECAASINAVFHHSPVAGALRAAKQIQHKMQVVSIQIHQCPAGFGRIKHRQDLPSSERIVPPGILEILTGDSFHFTDPGQPVPDLFKSRQRVDCHGFQQNFSVLICKIRHDLCLPGTGCHWFLDNHMQICLQRFHCIVEMQMVGNCNIDGIDSLTEKILEICHHDGNAPGLRQVGGFSD